VEKGPDRSTPRPGRGSCGAETSGQTLVGRRHSAFEGTYQATIRKAFDWHVSVSILRGCGKKQVLTISLWPSFIEEQLSHDLDMDIDPPADGANVFI
jgi:hypothetical protein